MPTPAAVVGAICNRDRRDGDSRDCKSLPQRRGSIHRVSELPQRCAIYTPAAFFERDTHEMFGVFFEGSPDMSKFILTEWDGPPPMRKDFDSEAWVNEHFDFQDYNPDWLQEIIAQGGGIAIRPDEQRFSRRSGHPAKGAGDSAGGNVEDKR